MTEDFPAWLRTPILQGGFLGFALPLLVVAPAVLFGDFDRLQAGINAYFLLPLLAPLAFPAGLGAALLQRTYTDRKALWRLAAGLFLGGSAAGTLLLATTTPDFSPIHRLGVAASGGVLLSGFWVWLGGLVGGFLAFERREARTAVRAGETA